MLKNLIKDKKGTAEVIGSVMFIVILLFFFTNVYLWHDSATKDMNELYVHKMNAGMEVSLNSGVITIIPKGSDVELSRLWIVSSSNHVYANLEKLNIPITVNRPINVTFNPSAPIPALGAEISATKISDTVIRVECPLPSGSVRVAVLNSLGVFVTS